MSERPLDFEDRDDQPAAAPPASASRPPARRSRNSWLIGVIVLAALVYVTINTLSTDSPGSRGVPDDEPLPPFAAPLALSSLGGDANLARERDGEKAAACEVRGPDVLNICQLAERGPVVLAFFVTRGGDRCERQLDGMERIRSRFPGVQFAAVAIRGDRGKLRALVRGRGWGFPVGYDHDGLVANVYAVAVCPTIVYAYPGGIVMRSVLGLETDAELAARIQRLVAGAKERGWTQPS